MAAPAQQPQPITVTGGRRRSKRDKVAAADIGVPTFSSWTATKTKTTTTTKAPRPKRPSAAKAKHGKEAGSGGGMEALLPSLIGVSVLVVSVMAKMGFRGRAGVAGIDLGTTNSVICVQAPAKGVGVIECIPDPTNNGSPVVPSVVSFWEPHLRPVGPSSKVPSLLDPHPSATLVGHQAKRRIESHPHHTLYNAKRVLGRPFTDQAVAELAQEVEFPLVPHNNNIDENNNSDSESSVAFTIPDNPHPIVPEQVGAYVVTYLLQLTKDYLGHDNVQSAVICVPAKFDSAQRRQTMKAFQLAGISVARIVEEPTAAALAYGLHRKEGVDYILVYDFGGGTLDVSLLHVSDGFVDVLGSDGDDRLGGADFDAAVAQYWSRQPAVGEAVQNVADRLAQLEQQQQGSSSDLEYQLSKACPILHETPLCTPSSLHTLGEQLKIALSEFPDSSGLVTASCLTTTTETPETSSSAPSALHAFCETLQPLKLKLSSEDYNASVQPLLDRSSVPVQRLLEDLSLREDEIDEVVMVGGTSRMPQIRQLVREVLPSAQLNTHIDPDLTVAYGAASVID